MAQTYVVCATNVAWSTSNKVLLSIWNGSGSNRVIRISRIWVLNNQITAITGIIQPYTLWKLTANVSGGTPTTLTPVPYDTTNEAIPAQIVFATNNTTNGTGIQIKRLNFSGDEPAVGLFSWDELEMLPVLNCIWDIGYGNTNVQKLTIRQNEGFSIYEAATASSAGTIDIFVEFTLSTT